MLPGIGVTVFGFKGPEPRVVRGRRRKKGPEINRALVYGGPKGDRTLDLCIANAALSQLSYRPYGRNYSLSLTVICKHMSSGCSL